MTKKNSKPRFQFSLRTLLVAVTAASLFMTYVGTYYRLSRRGQAEAAEALGTDRAFLYVPADEVIATKDLTRHHLLRVFFAPANEIDHLWFGGPEPIRDIIFDLSP